MEYALKCYLKQEKLEEKIKLNQSKFLFYKKYYTDILE